MAFSTWRYIQISVLSAALGLAYMLDAPTRNNMTTNRGLLNFVHLLSCCLWFGVQTWVTFVAGSIMFRHLTYHIFGFIQSKLLPVYFGVGSFLCFVAVVTFLLANPFCAWKLTDCSQMMILLLALISVLINELILQPRAMSVMFECQMKEKEHGLGDTCGKVDASQIKDDSNYVQLRKVFRRMHGASMLLNLSGYIAMGCHMWHLAMQLRNL